MAFRKRKEFQDFKPDAQSATWLKTMHLTELQRHRLAKWGLYIAAAVLALLVQDAVMSQVRLFGATTDLAVTVLLLITVIEGTEVGSLFILIASVIYFYSGTAPGAYSVALLTFLGVGATMLRQMYLNRSRGSIVLCAGAAQILYELGLYAVGIFNGLTRTDRLSSFLFTGITGLLIMIPLYPLIHKIGLIGGNTWKE